ncbi:hypothetical protein ACN6LI_005287 [Streptomyces violaceoruber]
MSDHRRLGEAEARRDLDVVHGGRVQPEDLLLLGDGELRDG